MDDHENQNSTTNALFHDNVLVDASCYKLKVDDYHSLNNSGLNCVPLYLNDNDLRKHHQDLALEL